MTAATVLIVDDNADNLSVLGDLLRDEYRVLAANSGARTLDLLRSGARPDLILLDVMMPGMGGYEVLQRIGNEPSLPRIPVMFVTARDAVEDEEYGLSLGAVDYVTKPLNPAIVLARVRTQVALKLAHDRLSDENTFLEAEIAKRMTENQHVQDVTVLALARLAEVRDPETGDHIRRTREYVRTLGEALARDPRFAPALTASTIAAIAKSAPLHDIGKVGIPDHILLKPGKLTPAEWEIMKTHAALGAEAIEQAERDSERPVAFLTYAKQIARHHHEYWNGNGYPDGLVGEAIPLAARMMALADVFDALISRRVYKDAMSWDEARALIVADRGEHFDPDVVDAFVANFAVFCTIAQRFSDTEASITAKRESTRGAA